MNSFHEMWILSANILFVGIGATLIMDIWAWLQLKLFSVKSLDYGLVGRWVCHFSKGTFKHHTIKDAQAVPMERALGWFLHYAIGVVFAAVLFFILGENWQQKSLFIPSMLVGIGSVVMPFFVLQPSFGLGLAGSKLPKPWIGRIKSLIAHTSFALGLYASANILKLV
ncbi:DUF2938 domain-containing protein [Bartonella sp. LJL80]